MKRRVTIIAAVVLVAGLAAFYGLRQEQDASASKSDTSIRNQEPPTEVKKTPPGAQSPRQQTAFNKNQFSLEDPQSPWVIVNKKRPLNPISYAPDALVTPNIALRSNITSQERQVGKVTAEALELLVKDAKKQGIHLTLESGYRSYNFQVNLYDRYVRQQGQPVADTQSARAGHSEHQTGLTADLGGITRPQCNVELCYADTIEGKWLAANAYTYGFIIRYPKDKTPITGYIYEPWHVRYVGVALSTEMHNQRIDTLEEFFNLPAAPDYN